MTSVPNGWKSIELDQIVDFANGKPLEGSVTADGIVNLITLDSIDIQGNLKSDHKKIKNSDGSLRAGDIVSVLSDLAHGNLLGLSAVIPHGAEFSLNQRMGRLRTKGDNSPEFIRLAVNFNQKYFKERGQGTSQRHIYRRDFDQLEILLPPEDEQKVIAEALSDIDEFILASRRLFRKKIDVMDSLLGELVSGQYFKKIGAGARFETIKNLGIEVKKGELITEKTAIEGEVPVIAGGVSAAYYHNTPNRTGITVTISASGANAGYVNVWRQPIWASDCSTINESAIFDVRYLYYILKGNQKNIYRSQYGGAQPHVRPNEIQKIVIPWTEKNTQKEIADLLDDFSNEIKDLETSIQKCVSLKHGMMNDLLTGKVRFV